MDLEEEKWNRKYKKNEKLNLVYAGSPTGKDQISLVINALYKIEEDCIFNVIGITKEEYLTHHIKGKYDLEKLLNKITFKGRVEHEETLNFVKNADFSIFFRENDRVTKAGFPTKFVESISAKTPVITNDNSNIKEYMEKYNLGVLVNSLEKEKILEALEKVILGKSDYNFDNGIFDYKNYTEKFMEFM